MKIKITQDLNGYKKGQEVEMIESAAQKLIKAKLAESIEDQVPTSAKKTKVTKKS